MEFDKLDDMLSKKEKILVSIASLTCFFTVILFFVGKNYFHGQLEEELQMEAEIYEDLQAAYELPKDTTTEPIIAPQQKKEPEKVQYSYFPQNLESEITEYKKLSDMFLLSPKITRDFENIRVNLYKNKINYRGKMRHKQIHLYGIKNMTKKEYLAVTIHEFGHFYDLYIMKKQLYKDLSEDFYNISWFRTKTIKAGQTEKDFVSGYAMTNKYEDFAETFTYFILHNNHFKKRATLSKTLQKKYDFFTRYVFRGHNFDTMTATFPLGDSVNWDTTKLDYNLKTLKNILEK